MNPLHLLLAFLAGLCGGSCLAQLAFGHFIGAGLMAVAASVFVLGRILT